MIFWQHNENFDSPPELKDLRYRKPNVNYWETYSDNKPCALVVFWTRWKKETGKEYPRELPRAPKVKIIPVINRRKSTGRPPVFHEKNKQDANPS